MLLLIRVNGFVYEPQLNTRHRVEQNAGHKVSGHERLAHDDVTLATMLNVHYKVRDAATRGGSPNTARDMYGLGPLQYSSFTGSYKTVATLVDHGADPTAGNNEGLLPIHRALQRGHAGVTELLIGKMERSTAR